MTFNCEVFMVGCLLLAVRSFGVCIQYKTIMYSLVDAGVIIEFLISNICSF